MTKEIRKLPWSSSEASFRDRKCTMSEMQETGHSINLNLLSLFHARACTQSLSLSLSLSLAETQIARRNKTESMAPVAGSTNMPPASACQSRDVTRANKRQQATNVTQSQKRRKGKQTCPCFWIRPIWFPAFRSLLVLSDTSLLLYKTPPQNALGRVPGTPPPTTTAHADSCSSLSSP